MSGRMIKAVRVYKQMTQAEMAEKVGVSRQTMVSIENEAVVPNPELLKKLEAVFDVSLADIEAAFSVFERASVH